MAADHDIIFATSFGYMDNMLKVAGEFPDVKFEHATGYKQSSNMASYGLRLYQARHVQGIIAGMMTKTNKICYVGAYPIPEVIREINTYYMGAKKMNPDVEIEIIWVNTWYDPVKEASAAEVMMAQGCDMVAQHMTHLLLFKLQRRLESWDSVKLLISTILLQKHCNSNN